MLFIAAHIVNRDDSRMMHEGGGPRFGKVPLDFPFAGEPVEARNLERYEAIQVRVTGEIDRPITATAKLLFDGEPADYARKWIVAL